MLIESKRLGSDCELNHKRCFILASRDNAYNGVTVSKKIEFDLLALYFRIIAEDFYIVQLTFPDRQK